ncbi:hypothetical protein DLAC_02152 [Tieghemostelium lacteum]|uniref:F-box domain-containing protein n=1 Tax=Tieghemostelium lacteum TaxID=361077 RepID=A0A152A483_TIELA|nr:hypothetical protein DLAC_02152 [Tieghemostelium lacteum]|eukprot:KYR01058.1 hypothetical protein DLAC_02152 [Tieghemostelium lacteum]
MSLVPIEQYIQDYYRSSSLFHLSKCFYCGTVGCNCQTTNEIQILESYNDEEFNRAVESFYVWASKPDEEAVSQTPTCSHYILKASAFSCLLADDQRFDKFTRWIDSSSLRQRIISYLFIVNCDFDKPHRYYKLFIKRMLTDIIAFQAISKLTQKMKVHQNCFDSYLEILEQISLDNPNVTLILTLIDQSRMPVPSSILVGLLQRNFTTLPIARKWIKAHLNSSFIMDTTKPLEFYKDLLLFSFENKITTSIASFYDNYKENFVNLCTDYLLENIDCKNERIRNICFELSLYRDVFGLEGKDIVTRIDEFIYSYISTLDSKIEKEKIENGFRSISDITPYFDNLLDVLPVYKYQYLFYNLPKHSLNEKRKNLLVTSSENILLIFKFFDHNDPVHSKLLGSFNNGYQTFREFDDRSLDCLFTLAKKAIDVVEDDDEQQTRQYILYFVSQSIIEIINDEFYINLCALKIQRVLNAIRKHIDTFYYFISTDHTYKIKSGRTSTKYKLIDMIVGINQIRTLLWELVPQSHEFLVKMGLIGVGSNSHQLKHYSNIFLFLGKHMDLEKETLLCWPSGEFYNLNVILQNVKSFLSQGLDLGLAIINRMSRDRQLIEDCQKLYDKPEPVPYHIKALCEITLCSALLPNGLDVNFIRDYYHNLDALYTNIKILNGFDFDRLNKLVHSDKMFCLKSDIFKKFYQSLPKRSISHLENIRLTYLLEKEYQDKIKGPKNILPDIQVPKLPDLLISKIIHYVFFDSTVHSLEKVQLAYVCKRWFDVCSDIVTNHYDQESWVTYLTVHQWDNINIKHRFSLFKQYPKRMLFHYLRIIDYDQMDSLLYSHLETLKLNIVGTGNAKNRPIYLEKDCMIKNIEFIIHTNDIGPGYYSFLKFCPMLENIVLKIYLHLDNIKEIFEYIFQMSLPSLKTIQVYLVHTIKQHAGFDLAECHQKYTKLPKLIFMSIPNYVHFSGFSSVAIKIVDDLDIEKMIQFYRLPLLTAKEEIRFSIKKTDLILPLIDFVDKYHQTKHMSLCICQLPENTLSINFVQSIFDRLNNTNNITQFSVFYNLYLQTPKYSILDNHNQWNQIDLKKFKYKNTPITSFYQTFQ